MFAILFVSILLFCVYILTNRRSNLPPGPPRYPIIGNIGQFDAKNLVEECRRLRRQYGDVFCIMIAHKPMIVVNGLETLRKIFVKNGNFTSERPGFFYTKVICKGLGIVGSSGHIWKEQRTFALTTLRSLRFGRRCLESDIREEVGTFLSIVDAKNGKPFDIYSHFTVSVSNIICAMVFGKLFHHNDEDFLKLLSMFRKHMSEHKFGTAVNFFPSLRHIPGDLFGIQKIIRNIMDIDVVYKRFISEHRQTLDGENYRDYIDAFLVAQNKHKNEKVTTFSDDQLLRTISDLFGAGTETTTTTLCWAVIYLVHNPDIQNKMKQEIDSIIAYNDHLTLAHKQQLPYCEAVIAESQRIGNIAPIALPHGVKEDFTFNGFVIPKDAFLLPNLDSVAFDSELFPEPNKFNPDRYIDAMGKFKGQDTFAPFFIGRRACLGESIARAELFLFLVSLVQQYELLPEQSDKKPSLDGIFGVTYGPQPFKIRAKKRL